jgi:hypothetical protein
MDWPKNYPFSIKNDFWIDTSKYVNLKDMKWEATFAITFAIAENDYQTAEEVAFNWIDLDFIFNKLNAAHKIVEYLKDWIKFTLIADELDKQNQITIM